MNTKIAGFEAGEMPQQAKLHADDLSSIPLHVPTHVNMQTTHIYTCKHFHWFAVTSVLRNINLDIYFKMSLLKYV